MDQFNLEIISPEKSFLIKKDTIEVIVPAIEGYMGILKDHIPIISFLKPGIINVKSKNDTLNFYVDDGIVEFKDNNLSILTSNIFDLNNFDKNNIDRIVKNAEEDLKKENMNDQERFILDQKIEVLNSLKLN
tara:strand:+ start:106 stop:501 length:396 start_codon:yes stop_codon:yes gene_type:complete